LHKTAQQSMSDTTYDLSIISMVCVWSKHNKKWLVT